MLLLLIIAGTSKAGWMIYTLCITSCFLFTVFGHLFRTYRKQHTLSFGNVEKEVTLQHFELNAFIDDIYDDIDANSLTVVTTSSHFPPQVSVNETINFVCDERQSSTAGDEGDEIGYLDLYFTKKEDENNQEEDLASQNKSLSSCSSNSDVALVDQDNTEYPKPYIQIQKYCPDDSNSSKVDVMVHQCIERSPCIDVDYTSDMY